MMLSPNAFLNQILQGDCVEVMRQLPDNCIDVIFADPPYNLQLSQELYRPNQTKVEGVFDDWDKFESLQTYDAFTKAWLTECKRVLKENGTIWVIGSYHNIFRVGAILQDLDFWILNDVVWIKSNPMPNFKGTRFNNAHETLIWASNHKESNYTFHYKALKAYNEDLQMRSDWYIPICGGEERIKVNGQKAHATQKPAELLFRVILSSTNPQDVILDPFNGSGTTAAVAKLLGRQYVGIERESFYIEVTKERLQKIVPLEEPILEHRIERPKTKVPFGNLVASNMIVAGEWLMSPTGKEKAQVMADGSLVWGENVGSIHQIGKLIQNKPSCNGWTFWYAVRDNENVLIDDLRQAYIKEYIDPNHVFTKEAETLSKKEQKTSKKLKNSKKQLALV